MLLVRLLCRAVSCYVVLCTVALCRATSWHVVPCRAVPCRDMSYRVVPLLQPPLRQILSQPFSIKSGLDKLSVVVLPWRFRDTSVMLPCISVANLSKDCMLDLTCPALPLLPPKRFRERFRLLPWSFRLLPYFKEKQQKAIKNHVGGCATWFRVASVKASVKLPFASVMQAK